jgi:hypothetical protein
MIYISWEQYEQNGAQLQANQTRSDALGVARPGSALLAGLLVCGRCGCEGVGMTTSPLSGLNHLSA